MTTDLMGGETDDGNDLVEVVWSFLPDKASGCNPWFERFAQMPEPWSSYFLYPERSAKHYETVWMGEYKDCDDK